MFICHIKKIALTALLLAAALVFMSCLNTFYDFSNTGKVTEYGDFPNQKFSKNFDVKQNVQRLQVLLKKLDKERKYMLLSDYAVGLMKLGKAAEARTILAELYRHYPGEYKLASNLGTAYELTGETDSAYQYINRGIQLNPNDHQGSEWIHLKILAAKKALMKDAKYLDSHTVLNLSQRDEKDSMVYVQLMIQLQERVPFSPGPDPIMASLMVDLGDLAANTTSLRHAVAYYNIAQKYYGDSSAATRAKLNAAQALANKYSSRPVTPSSPQSLHGEYNPIGYINYKQLLEDKNPGNYKAAPGEVFTDVNTLLGLVNFGLTPLMAKSNDTGTVPGEPRLVLEPADTAGRVAKKPPPDGVIDKPQGKGRKIALAAIGIFLLGSVLFFFLKRKQQ